LNDVKFALLFAIKFNKNDVPLLGTPTIKTGSPTLFERNFGKIIVSKNKNKCVKPTCKIINGTMIKTTKIRFKVGRRKLFFWNEKALKISFNIAKL
jgi:hypothetical protein